MRRVHPTYAARDKILSKMGFISYKEYLASALWKGIRSRAWRLFGSICRLCDARARVIHHIGYGKRVLTGQCLKSLAPLCDECHEKVEFDARKRKRTLVGAHTAYVRLLKKARDADKTKIKTTLRGRCEKCGRRAERRMPYCRPCRAIIPR